MLLTLGDSFTVKRFEGDKPWPEMLSEMMSKELINISCEGVSNQWMFRNLIWALNEYNDISAIVVSLTNWDRLEVPYNNYAHQREGLGEKTKSLKPKQILEDPKNPWSTTYAEHYSVMYYVDATASYILAMSELARIKNIPIIFIQALLPFNNFSVKELATGVWNFKTEFTPHEENYVESMSLINQVNKNLFTKFEISSKSILYWDIDDQENPKRWFKKRKHIKDYKNLFHYFITWDETYQMGYHAHDVYKGGTKFKTEWDAHPNRKGHKLIAKTVLDHYNSIPEDLEEYYGESR